MENQYTHIVKSIVSKRTDGRINPYHSIIEGAKCRLSKVYFAGEPYWFIIERKDLQDIEDRVRTSYVESYEQKEDGTVILQTKNSTYTFEKLEEVVER